MHNNRILLLVALISAGVFAHGPAPLRAQTNQAGVSRIGAISESSLVVLSGNHHPLATIANDRGEVSPDLPMERMLLVLNRDAATESTLQSFLARQQDKSSPDFHAWLSPVQFGERFGA